MKVEVPRYAWEFIGSCSDSEIFKVSGTNIWEIKWNSTGEKIDIVDPIYKQKFNFSVYTFINNYDEEVKFAAGEFSNCYWGFYEYVDRAKAKERYEREKSEPL